MNPNCRHSSRSVGATSDQHTVTQRTYPRTTPRVHPHSSMMGGCRGSFSCSFASSQMNALWKDGDGHHSSDSPPKTTPTTTTTSTTHTHTRAHTGAPSHTHIHTHTRTTTTHKRWTKQHHTHVSCRVTSCRGRARSLCALVRNRDSRHDVSTPRGRLSSARRLDLTRWCPPGRRECTLFDRQQQQLVVFRQHVAQQRAQQRAQRHVSTSSSHVRSAVLLMYTSTSTRPCCLTVEMSWPVMNTKPKCDPSLVTFCGSTPRHSAGGPTNGYERFPPMNVRVPRTRCTAGMRRSSQTETRSA